MELTLPAKTHIALLATPGMGHLIPVLELGQRFMADHRFDVTVIVLTTDASTAQSQLRHHSYRDLLNIVLLPPVDISNLVTNSMHIVSQILLLMHQALPLLRSAIAAMKPCPAALIVDIFGTAAFDIANEFEMLKYVYDTSNAWFLAITLYHPHLDETKARDHVHLRKPLDIPGCAPLEYADTPDLYQLWDRDLILRDDFVKVGLEIAKADGILMNSWEHLETRTLKALRDPNLIGRFSSAPIHTIGPLVRPVKVQRAADSDSSQSKVLDWLDQQPAESVLYVSFGSGGTLSADQLVELAWGLELSQQRFIWVVRPPLNTDASDSYYFNLTKERADDGTPSYLPEGFISRTEEVGLVIEMWAPQAEILAHKSIGGFLSHCGWNSTLESMVNGVPMICWPLYAEQTINAAMLADHLGVAVRSREVGPKGVIGREVIEKLARRVMEKDGEDGKQVRAKALDLKRSAEDALAKGGSSHGSLARVAKECEMGLPGVRERARGA